MCWPIRCSLLKRLWINDPKHLLLSFIISSFVLSSLAGVFVTDDQEEEEEGLGADLSFIGSHAFARMEGDIDKQRRLILQGQLSEAALQKQHQRK